MKRLTEMYQKAQSQVQAKLCDEKGATMVEYALMLALIAAVCVGVVTTIGTGALDTFTTINTSLNPGG